MKIVYLMGGTCCGKSTFIDKAKQHYGETAGFIEVGKLLRAKYPPEHFKGSAAPDHTEQEALELYHKSMLKILSDSKIQYVFVDGQPRRPSQVTAVLSSFNMVPKQFLLFTASADEQARRAAIRFARDGASLKLAIDRIENDRKQGYDTLVELLAHKRNVVTIGACRHPTNYVGFTAMDMFNFVRREIETVGNGLVYLAAPLSHDEYSVRVRRYVLVTAKAAELIKSGLNIFSPITHSHQIAETGNLPTGWEYWRNLDLSVLNCCDRMIVLRLPGWEESVGVRAEVEYMAKLGKDITYIDP